MKRRMTKRYNMIMIRRRSFIKMMLILLGITKD